MKKITITNNSTIRKLIRLSKSSILSSLVTKKVPLEEIFETATKLEKEKGKSVLLSEQEVDKIIELASQNSMFIITFYDTNYPEDLKLIESPPIILYGKGNIDLISKVKFAIVGARVASFESIEIAKQFSRELSIFGFTIVSGFAHGVDTGACIGALPFGTIQVLGSGINVIYPRQNEKLYNEVLNAGGLFLSEFPPNTSAKPEHFPLRNRIISGLSKGVLLVQASKKNGSSGSLITAKIALSQGKDLFAIPGHPMDLKFEGGNHLLKHGDAIFTTRPEDILDFLSYTLKPNEKDNSFKQNHNRVALNQNHKKEISEIKEGSIKNKIFNILSTFPISIEEICNLTGLALKDVQISIAEMEILNEVRRHTGGKFSISLL